MTLLLTMVAGDGIVMGADSSLFWREQGEELTLTGFPKIIPVPRLNMGISVAGSARIGAEGRSSWVSPWLQKFALEGSKAESFTAFADELVETLNEEARNTQGDHAFQLAGWVRATDDRGAAWLIPRAFEVSKSGGQYRWASLLPDSFVKDIVGFREGKRDPYPIRILSTGLPKAYATWIATEGFKLHTQLLGSQVPFPHVTALAEYVRFLIRSIAELHKIARRPAIVAEPIETLLLLPDAINMLSQRY